MAVEGRRDGAGVGCEMGDDHGFAVKRLGQFLRQPLFLFEAKCHAVLGCEATVAIVTGRPDDCLADETGGAGDEHSHSFAPATSRSMV